MQSPRASVGLFVVLIAAFAPGCSDGRPGVSGTVKYKGAPLAHGTISFIPEGTSSPAGGATIVNGAYEVHAAAGGLPPGKYKVSISMPDTKAAQAEAAPGMSGPPPKELLPAKYNANTELTAEVKAGVKNAIDYDLK